MNHLRKAYESSERSLMHYLKEAFIYHLKNAFT